ncbi:MAG: MFS transporter [Armatimonadota bacterium]|nr:MFS transporter [Armatimonadota bacterium]
MGSEIRGEPGRTGTLLRLQTLQEPRHSRASKRYRLSATDNRQLTNRQLMLNVLRNRDYRLYWTGTLVSWVGTHLQGAAQAWYIYQITEKTFYVGLVGFFGQLPMVLTLLGGVVADRVDKRRLLLIAQSGLMVIAFVLGALVDAHLAGVWTIAVLAMLAGMMSAFETPARHSLPAHLVGKKLLIQAIPLTSAAFNVARILGPAIAGALVSHVGVAKCFYANGFSFIAVIVALAMIRSDTSPACNGDNPIWADFWAGMGYIYRHPTIRPLVLMSGIPSLLVLPYLTLMPELASKVLGLKATGYGSLMSSVGIGAALGAFRLAGDTRGKGRGKMLLLAGMSSALVMLALSFSRSYPLSVVLFMLLGASNVTYNQTINTLVQTLADNEYRARAVSAFIFVFVGLAPIGSLMAGYLAGAFGVTVPLIVGGFGVATLISLIALTQPEIRRL